MTNKFFEERREQSEVKARIVQKYFAAWSNIVVGAAMKFGGGKIAYIDLYAGPGRYRDGAASTPLLVLEEAIKNDRVRNALVALLNDRDENNTSTLQKEIDGLPGIETLKHKPTVQCGEVGKDAEDYFNQIKLIPAFTFFDPFGYKGLSLRLVNGVIKDWGCDCIFFFNYNRINMGLTNKIVKDHLDALFGEERADALRESVRHASPNQRQEMILEELATALAEMGGEYVLPFRFKNESGRLTHHLIFVSKHFKGYDVMKQIMHRESSTQNQGVGSFAYAPADEAAPMLFELTRPLDDLKGLLLERYRGRTISLEDLYEEHSVGLPFIIRHYKEVLTELEKEGLITVRDPLEKKRRGFADRLVVTFGKGN